MTDGVLSLVAWRQHRAALVAAASARFPGALVYAIGDDHVAITVSSKGLRGQPPRGMLVLEYMGEVVAGRSVRRTRFHLSTLQDPAEVRRNRGDYPVANLRNLIGALQTIADVGEWLESQTADAVIEGEDRR